MMTTMAKDYAGTLQKFRDLKTPHRLINAWIGRRNIGPTTKVITKQVIGVGRAK